jgi:hypothetical protein
VSMDRSSGCAANEGQTEEIVMTRRIVSNETHIPPSIMTGQFGSP